MSVAVIPMAKELGWSAMERGLVSSAFFWGYALTQIPAGWVSTRCAAAVTAAAPILLFVPVLAACYPGGRALQRPSLHAS
jgi:ACS family sodium-dependent inorganic phosphate cotransporter